MKKFFEEFFEVMYALKDIVSTIILGSIGVIFISEETCKLEFVLITLIMFWCCLVIREVHKENCKKREREIRHNKKRFTHLNEKGDPIIMIEDLPEIIEYLYRLEESSNDNLK